MPSRRDVIVGIPLLLTGCTELQNGFNSGDGDDEIPSSDQIAGVFAVPITEGYENEPITYHTDDRIHGVTVLQTLIEMVVDSDIPPESVQKRENSDDPELVSIGPDHNDFSQNDLYEAVEALSELPQVENPDWGRTRWYIEHPEQVLRVSYALFD